MSEISNLTERELQILALVVSGLSNKSIAYEIQVSEKTVEFHLDNIYTKLGTRTRLLAAMWAVRQGMEGNSA